MIVPTHRRAVTAFAAALLSSVALAQPAATPLGTVTLGTPINVSVPAISAGNVAWYTFTLAAPIRYEDLRFLQITNTNGVGTGGSDNAEIGLYTAAGVRVAADDDDGLGTTSLLTFGTGTGVLPVGTTPTVSNGRDGDLAAGVYYLGVAYTGVSFGSTNWSTTFGTTLDLYPHSMTILANNTTPTAPGSSIDLGTLPRSGNINRTDPLAAGQVRWYKVVLPDAVAANLTYVDIDTESTSLSASNATRVTLYGPNGAVQSTPSLSVVTDTTDGSGSLSQLTFGQTNPTRPPVGDGLTYNGRDGTLRAGTYYVAVSSTPSATPSQSTSTGANFGMTSTSTNTGTVALNFASSATQTVPSGVGVATPAAIGVGDVAVCRVTVTPGANPPSTLIAVQLDTSLVDGGGLISLLDNGVAPDLFAGDGIYSANVTSGPFANLALNALPFTITDFEGRVGNGTMNLTVSAPTQPTGVTTVTPTFGPAGTVVTVSVLVTPGNYPPSTALTVSLDAASVDGGTVPMLDDGIPPDVTLGDGRYTCSVTVGPSAGSGAQTMTVNMSDAQLRTNTANANFTVIGPPPACPTGNETFTFTGLSSDGAAGAGGNGVGTFTPTGTYNVVAYRITGQYLPNNVWSNESRIRIMQPSGATTDVQPFLVSTPTGVPADYISVDLTVPCAPVANGGAWEVRTFESFDDGGVDGVWNGLCIGLVGGPPGGDPLVWSGDICVGDAGDLPDSAQIPTGSGQINSIVGNLNTTTDVDMFKIGVCDFATFTATTVGNGNTGDTKLMLFNLDGTGVMHNDDSTGLLSTIDNSGNLLSANGDYYLAVVRYNRTAVDAGNQAIWHVGTPFTGVIAPDGPGALNPVAGWINTAGGTGAYTIAMTGVCYPSGGGGGGGCNIADITDVGDTGNGPDDQLTYDDILLFINTFGDGTGCPGASPCSVADITDVGDTGGGPDGQLTYDDLLLYINTFGEGC